MKNPLFIALAFNLLSSLLFADEPSRIWIDPVSGDTYEYIGAGPRYLANTKCKEIGRDMVSFKSYRVRDGRIPPYYEEEVIRVMNSPLKIFLAVKYEHAEAYAFWAGNIYGDYAADAAITYKDEMNAASNLVFSQTATELHILCVTKR